MNRLNEREIINIFAQELGISDLDDVSPVSKNLVLKCDMLISSTDVPPQMKPWQIARKSVVSCASDLAAKGARPTAAMVSLGLPAGTARVFIKGLAEGFARASKEFGIKIVGGDTNEAAELVIDCCMLGKIVSRMPQRSGAKPGDLVVVSGLFGLPAAGLSMLLKGSRAPGDFAKRAAESVLEPTPRQKFGIALARFFSSSIDSSDGLAISLYEIARNSGVDIWIDNIPAAAGLEEFATENGRDAKDFIFHGGEEYEIVATIPRSKFRLAKLAAKRAKINIYQIGIVKKGQGRVYVNNKRLEDRGYVHFSQR
ncbi:MAG TPA: thiamine-phosphate kinase [Nitrososphaera sp.]|jgi:thiamine-monophosphate kinase|nr:thiamine-phosphate kinase [Nitrososphaera sp.]